MRFTTVSKNSLDSLLTCPKRSPYNGASFMGNEMFKIFELIYKAICAILILATVGLLSYVAFRPLFIVLRSYL